MKPTLIVPAGEFIVSRPEQKILQALLGSCVGLVLFDRSTLIGGLYHILLPNHSSDNIPGNPKLYANSGLPLFFEALIGKGAKAEKLQAFIAGGALFSQNSETEFRLDIGGRTVEIVENFLSEKKIPIVQTETGGYLNTVLSFHLPEGKVDVDVNGGRDGYSLDKPVPISEVELSKVVKRVRPIPQIALKVIRMVHSQSIGFHEISSEIKMDQVLSAKIISFSNSALYAPPSEITSIDRALVFLGEKKLLMVILSAVTETFFQTNTTGYSLAKGMLFHHSTGCALAAQAICEKLDINIDSDVAYTAGLLHDLGKVVLDQYVAKYYPYIYRQLITSNLPLIKVERDIFGYDHAQIGLMLSKMWGLPPDIQDVVAWHHDPAKAEHNPKLTALIYVANLIISRFQSGQVLDLPDINNLHDALNFLNISKNELSEIIEVIPWQTIIPLFNPS